MFITYRYWLKYGREDDPVEITVKEHKTFEKAYSYAKRYSKGLKFISCSIKDNEDNLLYEIFDYGAQEEDYRTIEDELSNDKEIEVQETTQQKITQKFFFKEEIINSKKNRSSFRVFNKDWG